MRFTKPARVLEVGAGYTSMFLLQALADNAAELEARGGDGRGWGGRSSGLWDPVSIPSFALLRAYNVTPRAWRWLQGDFLGRFLFPPA